MGFNTIQNSDYSNRLIANLPTRPNASPGNFGGGGLTAVQMKQAYDAMPLFIIGRLNALIEYINGRGDESLSAEILNALKSIIAKHIETGISDEIKTLKDLFDSVKNGNLAKALFVPSGDKSLNEMIGVLNDYEAKFNDYDSKYARFESVSTSLLGFEPRLSRVEKQVENFYKGGALPIAIDDSVAYSKTVPDGVLPYAEVAKVGGMSHKSENMAIPNARSANTNGFESSADGNGRLVVTGSAASTANTVIDLALMRSDGTRHSIPLAAGVEYSWSVYKDGVSLAEYVDGLNFQIDYTDAQGGTVWSWGGQDISRPRAVKRIYIQKEVEAGSTALCGTYAVMLNRGSTALPYSPYFEGLRHAKVTAVKSIGANLFDKSKVQNANETDTGFSFTNTGVLGAPFEIGMLKTIAPHLKAGDSVVFYTECVNGWQAYGHLYLNGSQRDWRSGSFVTIEQADLDASVFAYGAQGVVCEYKYFRIVKTENAPYSPYTESTLPIPTAVQDLPEYGLGVSAAANNHIDWSERKYHRTCGVVDMGTLDWNGFGGYFAHTGSIFKPSANVISALPSPFDTIRVDIYGALVVTFADGSFTSADDVESAMSGVMLVYELATPDEPTDISHLITKDDFIPVEAGGQIVAENEHGLAAPTEIIYQLTD